MPVHVFPDLPSAAASAGIFLKFMGRNALSACIQHVHNCIVKNVKKIIAIMFFLCVFAGFFTPMELGDVWWHMSTGQWILDSMSLPEQDPFTISSDPLRDHSFVLKGFWLSQILFHLIASVSGLFGLIAFKSAIFTAAVFLMWRGARMQGASFTLAYICIIPAVFIFAFYDEARPQTLSILFTAFVLLVLEGARRPGSRFRLGDKQTHQERHAHGKPWPFLLVPLMPVWANMHPGYVIGLGFIMLYAVEHIVASFISKNIKMNNQFIVACAASITLSALNPNGLKAVLTSLAMLRLSTFGTVTIHEHLGVSQFAARTGDPSLMVLFVILASLGIASFVVRRRSLDILHLFVFVSLAGLTLVSFRAGLFFAIASAHIIGYNLAGLNIKGMMGISLDLPADGSPASRRQAVTAIICLLFAGAMLVSTRSVAAKGIMSPGIFPDKAATYILEASSPANIYHPYEWGGYLIWRLYPRYKAFVDGRALIPLSEYFEVQNAGERWPEILESREVSTVVFWTMLPFKKRIPPIVFALAGDPGWKAVYWDTRSLVFVRTAHARHPLGKNAVWELLQSLVSRNIALNPSDAENYIVFGEVLVNRGQNWQAREAFERALALDPANREAAQWLRLL